VWEALAAEAARRSVHWVQGDAPPALTDGLGDLAARAARDDPGQ